jgi:hypothetical protein
VSAPGHPNPRPPKGSRPVSDSTRAALQKFVRERGQFRAYRELHTTETTLDKALAGMPLVERVAQRLEDWAQEHAG